MNKKSLNLILSAILLVLCGVNFILNLGRESTLSMILSGAAVVFALLIMLKEIKDEDKK